MLVCLEIIIILQSHACKMINNTDTRVAYYPCLPLVELAVIMNKYYSGVCYAGIDVDPELKYPKGAGRVAFSNHTSYINAINNRFIQLKIGDIDKKVGTYYCAQLDTLDNSTVFYNTYY